MHGCWEITVPAKLARDCFRDSDRPVSEGPAVRELFGNLDHNWTGPGAGIETGTGSGMGTSIPKLPCRLAQDRTPIVVGLSRVPPGLLAESYPGTW